MSRLQSTPRLITTCSFVSTHEHLHIWQPEVGCFVCEYSGLAHKPDGDTRFADLKPGQICDVVSYETRKLNEVIKTQLMTMIAPVKMVANAVDHHGQLLFVADDTLVFVKNRLTVDTVDIFD